MGIQTWFPRRVLPNAQPARPFDWLVEAEEASVPTSGTRSLSEIFVSDSPAPPPTSKQFRPSDILKSVSLSQPAANAPVAPAPTTKPAVRAKPAITIATFRLVIIPLGQDHLVVAEMPYTGLSQFTRYHHRMLQDLARAFKLPQPSAEPVREFVWPLASIAAHQGLFSQISQDDKAATDAVDAFLANQYGLSRKKVILLLGQAAAHFVFDQTRAFEELRGIHPDKSTGQIVAITHGLNELMKIPSLKPETWQDLQALISA